jgi:membrane protein implicated in regulation of membrane protease activity
MSIHDTFILIGLLLVFVELVVGLETGFDLVVIGFTMAISGFVGGWLNSTEVTIGLTIGLSVLYIVLGRSVLKNKLKTTTHKTNADRLVGSIGEVRTTVTADTPGLVNIDGEDWRAKSTKEKFQKGSKVIVTNIEGVTVLVKAI